MTLGGGAGSSALSSEIEEAQVADVWAQDIRRLCPRHPDFFSSEEACLRIVDQVRPGTSSYQSLPINEKNNTDLRQMYNIEYRPKHQSIGSHSTFQQLSIVAGQLLRISVVRGKSDVSQLWRSGQLFRVICDRNTVELLIEHFKSRTVCTTVTTKSIHLKKIAQHAKMYYMGKDSTMCAQSEAVHMFVNANYNVQKTLGRQRTAERRQLERRFADGAVFMPADFSRCKERVKRSLENIMDTVLGAIGRHHGDGNDLRTMNKALIRKWCINFLVLLVLCAGGQRPQVYTQLQVPSEQELTQMGVDQHKNGFIRLIPMKEKTVRSLNMPFVMLPAFTFRYIKFHLEHIRPAIFSNSNTDEEALANSPLLLHTETCQHLSSANVTRTFQKFLEVSEPALAKMSIMNIRSSYGTMMMIAYRNGDIFQGDDEATFLGTLATQMNTSVEQLEATYIAIDHSDYDSSARKLMQALCIAMGEKETPTSNEAKSHSNSWQNFFE